MTPRLSLAALWFCAGAGLLLGAGRALGALPPAPEPPPPVKSLAREVLKSVIETNTVLENGSTALAEQLAARFHAAGFSADDLSLLAPADHPNKANLIVKLRGRGKAKPLLFIAHLDVVEAKPEDWTVDPFKLTEKDGYFYGRGTQDMKNDVAALVTDLIRLKGENYVPERDIIVAFTADEETETDANGVAWLVKNHRDLIDAEMVFNPDAGGGVSVGDHRLYLGVETSEKIYLTFQIEVTNKGGHSSQPEPDNAIYRLAAALGRIARYEFPVRLNSTTKAYFSEMAKLEKGQLAQDMLAVTETNPPAAAIRRLQQKPMYNSILRTTCVATMIEGGHAENALPQRARARIQCRILPDDSQTAVQAALVKAVNDPAVSFSVLAPAKASPESPLTPALTAKLKAVVDSMWPGVPLVPDMDTGASDSIYTRAAGLPSYGITGSFIDIDDVRAHGRDERLPVANFYNQVEFTYRLIKALGAE